MKRYHVRKGIWIISLFWLIAACSSTRKTNSQSSSIYETRLATTPDVMVPDQETAIKIAEAIWVPIYGDDVLNEKPYVAKLVGNVWVVRGSLPPQFLGGTAYIEIRKSDCTVLNVTHFK